MYENYMCAHVHRYKYIYMHNMVFVGPIAFLLALAVEQSREKQRVQDYKKM